MKNIASYTQLTSDLQSDVIGTNFTIPDFLPTPVGPGRSLVPLPTGALAGTPIGFVQAFGAPSGYHQAADQYTASEELQFQGRTGDGKFIWQAGIYGELSGPLGVVVAPSGSLVNCTNAATFQCTDPLRNVFLSVTPPAFQSFVPAIGTAQEQANTIKYRNLGIYAQATYSLTDKLKLTGGIRYTDDKTRSTGTGINYLFLQDNVPTPVCTNSNTVLENGCSITLQQKSAKPTWLISADYKPNNDVLLYAKYARGYRQGSVAVSSAINYQTFAPESVDSYEAGTKLSFHGAVRGYFNVAAFYNKLSNQQLEALFTPIVGRTEAGIVNAGKSRVYGIEVDSAVSLFRGLNINGSYAYLNARLQSIAPTACDPLEYVLCQVTTVAGQDLAQSPRHKFSIGGSYQLPFDGSVGQVTAGAVFSYQTSQLFGAAAGIDQKQPGYGLLNLNLNWDNVAEHPVDLSVFATNALNKKYRNFIFGILNSANIEVTHYGEPRMIGVKLRYRFSR